MAPRVSPSEAAEILSRLRSGERQKDVAAALGRAPATIRLIQRGVHAVQRGRNLYPPDQSPDGLTVSEGPADGLFRRPAARCNLCGAKGVSPCVACHAAHHAALSDLSRRVLDALDGEPLGLGLKPEHHARYLEVRSRRQAVARPAPRAPLRCPRCRVRRPSPSQAILFDLAPPPWLLDELAEKPGKDE